MINMYNDFDNYQDLCGDTDVGTSAQDNLKPGWLYYVLGISGETGEFQEKVNEYSLDIGAKSGRLTEVIKKLFRDDYGKLTEERKKAIILEMGDMMWYMARLCAHLDIPFHQVAKMNIEKLQSRKSRNKLKGDGDNR